MNLADRHIDIHAGRAGLLLGIPCVLIAAIFLLASPPATPDQHNLLRMADRPLERFCDDLRDLSDSTILSDAQIADVQAAFDSKCAR